MPTVKQREWKNNMVTVKCPLCTDGTRIARVPLAWQQHMEVEHQCLHSTWGDTGLRGDEHGDRDLTGKPYHGFICYGCGFSTNFPTEAALIQHIEEVHQVNTSYPYFVFAEDYVTRMAVSPYSYVYTSHRIAFFTKKSGEWVEHTVDTHDSADANWWSSPLVNNNGADFCIVSWERGAYGPAVYRSTDEGDTWEKVTPVWPAGAEPDSDFSLISAKGSFAFYDFSADRWFVSIDMVNWEAHDSDYVTSSQYLQEWVYVDPRGRTHVVESDDDANVRYFYCDTLGIPSDAEIIIPGEVHYEGISITGHGDTVLVTSVLAVNTIMHYAISRDRGETWENASFDLSSVLGTSYTDNWSVTPPRYGLLTLEGDDAYVTFSWADDEADYPEYWNTHTLKASNISTYEVSWELLDGPGYPVQAWWLANATTDPIASTGWKLMTGYTDSGVEYEGDIYEQWDERSVAILNVEDSTAEKIYTLLGNNNWNPYAVVLGYGESGSRITNGYTNLNCYRRFT